MPANEEYLRSPNLMHRVFCGSALLLLLVTVWMMWADYNDEWRTYQRQAFKFQGARLKAREESMKSAPEHVHKVAEIEKRIAALTDQLKSVAAEETQAKQDVQKAADSESNHLRALKLQRAVRDVARANYNLGIRDDKHGAALKELMTAYDGAEDRVAAMESEFSELKLQTIEEKAKLSTITGRRDAAEKELKAENTAIGLMHAALNKIEPDTWFSSWKRRLMMVPIVEGFNSYEKPVQDWLPDLQITLGGMANVARFDRCRTCHSLIDVVDDTVTTSIAGAFPHGSPKDGKFEHPYASHPKLDLYLSALSPHPLPKFGCTVCHEGQGSGTSFQNASHTPDNPVEMEAWEKEHKWFDNHFWERPMNPTRFQESSCIKCHINVIELGTNEKFGPTAPKVVRGHNLIQTYGCFGCHEISGYDGNKIVGPDLRLEPNTAEEAAEIAKDPNQVAGTERKVGPSLRHLGAKADAGFVSHWTEEPKRFRPTTRMPQFFLLDNQMDDIAGKYNPVEIAAISHYLLSKSEKLETLVPPAGYKPDAERGREFFATKGCVVCHTHHDVAGLDASFGPELSKVHAKLKAGQQGFDWLYTWIREPERHHPRTKMPHLFLEAEGSGDKLVDPAADIAAFLLKLEGAPADFKPTQQFKAPEVSDEVLNELVGYFLMKVLTKSQVEAVMDTGKYPIAADKIKGDEIELASEKELDANEFRNRKMNYLGRKSITRYGCYGCHDIPNFESARPIGTALQDWGKKDRSRLAFEHIQEYLHHHGQAGLGVRVQGVDKETAERLKRDNELGVRVAKAGRGPFKYDDILVALDGVEIKGVDDYEGQLERTVVGSTVSVSVWRDGQLLDHPVDVKADTSMHDRVDDGIGQAERHEFKSKKTEERELSAAFYYESLMHHGRPGFLWQKLRQPRSYDYKMIETKAYDDRLRMPEFPFTEDDIDAIATFIVGLVVEPPAPAYMYNPGGAKGAVIKGEKLLQRYNCTGCHMLELPKFRYATELDGLTASDADAEYPEAVALLRKLRPAQKGLTGHTKSIKTADGLKDLPIIQFHGMVTSAPDPDDSPEDQEYTVETWDHLDVGGKEFFPTTRFSFPALSLDGIDPARGGAYAEWLVKRLLTNKVVDQQNLAWQMSPPPLYKQGTKVQTPWLFNFLRNPGRLRHTTVLRMPKFNMSDSEAQSLANYFAAADGAEFPYQLIAEKEPGYLNSKDREFHTAYPDKKQDYLQESWQLLNAPLCIKCHSVGGRQVVVSDPAKDIRGPNLEMAAERLKPDWMLLWLSHPTWITPYTSMPAPFQKGKPDQFPELFGGNGLWQTVSLRDALVNYYKLMEREGKVASQPKPAAGAGGQD
ncbi:MAG: c-type cytochrome [Planctomycetes bacterium]|nr:c-type cytochrome [Planctomycetota bacterium]